MFLLPDIVLLKGVTDSGQPLSILRAGIVDRQAAYFFAGHVFAELRSERMLGRAWLWSLLAAARQHRCDFVLFRVSELWRLLARWLLRCGSSRVFHLPLFVAAVVDLKDRSKLLRSSSVREDVRRITKGRFRFSISRKEKELVAFVRSYHNPWTAKVHGFDAVEMDLSRLLASCSAGEMPETWELLKVEQDGEWVAAALLTNAPGRAALMELGVKDADSIYVKRGALQAAYWLSFEYLRAQGHKWVSLMYARPFARNGVLQYKLKFGPRLKPAASKGFLLLFDPESDAAREILLREPLLVREGESLRAVWFSSDDSAPPNPAYLPVDRLVKAGVADIERVVLRNRAVRAP